MDECYEELNCPSKIDVGTILGKVNPGECHKKECKMHVGKEQFHKFLTLGLMPWNKQKINLRKAYLSKAPSLPPTDF